MEAAGREGIGLRRPCLFPVWVQVLKSHGGSRTIRPPIPARASPFALLQGSTMPKVNSYGTHLGRNGNFQKHLGLPSDYQTTETRVPKILEFSWESHAGRGERRSLVPARKGGCSPGKEFTQF